MVAGHKIVFLTFADSRFDSWKRLKKEAKAFGVFDEIVAGDERMFETWYRKKYQHRFSDRGFGYYSWKSYLIRRELERLDEGDILLYCDSGCALNPQGKHRFEEYLDIVSKSASGILVFDQGMPAREWTKYEVFEYFDVLNRMEYLNSGQMASGYYVFCEIYECNGICE